MRYSALSRLAVGPPVGGILYSRYGYRGPFVFSIAATILDLTGRLIIIERKDAVVWGYDPAVLPITKDKEEIASVAGSGNPSFSSQIDITDASQTLGDTGISSEPSLEAEVQISLLAVMYKLFKSRRALVALFIIFAYGYDQFLFLPSRRRLTVSQRCLQLPGASYTCPSTACLASYLALGRSCIYCGCCAYAILYVTSGSCFAAKCSDLDIYC